MTTAPQSPSDEQSPADLDRSSRRRHAIIDAATRLFLSNGYAGTSMDEIAALAGASKQTLYKHFVDKERLFSSIVMSTVNEASDEVYAALQQLPDSGDIEADLNYLARRQLELVMQPRILQLRRLVTAEAGRFPALGRSFYERGPGRTIAGLAAAFAQLGAAGKLRVEDPELAAGQFNWLVMAIPLNRAMLLGEDDLPPAAELDRYAGDGVRTFLAAYGGRAAST
jgi:TetR/AcrR family transcriptional regulator, mexJK operon transcriptional repressor